MLVPILGLLALAVGIGTTWLMASGPTVERDPDARFWYGFCGFCVLAPLVLGTVLLDPWAGAGMLAALACTCLAACGYLRRAAVLRAEADARSRAAAEHLALEERHDRVLRAWGRYELDPAAAIESPGMNDVRVPETGELARALARAERLRRNPPDPGPGSTAAGYGHAVAELESAFRRAEQRLGRAPARTDGAR